MRDGFGESNQSDASGEALAAGDPSGADDGPDVGDGTAAADGFAAGEGTAGSEVVADGNGAGTEDAFAEVDAAIRFAEISWGSISSAPRSKNMIKTSGGKRIPKGKSAHSQLLNAVVVFTS